MTVDEAVRHLEERARRRCDGYTVTWSLEDVTAIRTLVAASSSGSPARGPRPSRVTTDETRAMQ